MIGLLPGRAGLHLKAVPELNNVIFSNLFQIHLLRQHETEQSSILKSQSVKSVHHFSTELHKAVPELNNVSIVCMLLVARASKMDVCGEDGNNPKESPR